MPLWAALRARTFAVQIIAIGTGAASANRADTVLRSWTRNGDGQGAADPAGPTKADPEIQQELAWLERALSAGDRQMLNEAGGWEKASDRFLYLSELPDGTPTQQTARGAIDRFTIWPTVRLTTPSRSRSDGAPEPCPVPWQARWQARWQGKRDADRGGGVPKPAGGGVPSPPSIFRCRCSGFLP